MFASSRILLFVNSTIRTSFCSVTETGGIDSAMLASFRRVRVCESVFSAGRKTTRPSAPVKLNPPKTAVKLTAVSQAFPLATVEQAFLPAVGQAFLPVVVGRHSCFLLEHAFLPVIGGRHSSPSW